MLLHVPDVLTSDELRTLRSLLNEAAWRDGRTTAGTQAVQAKNNEQIATGTDTAQAAQQLVLQTLTMGQNTLLPRVGRVFLYMPLMHAEDLALQDECVARFTHLLNTATPERREALASNLRFAQQHRDIVAQYGRFPYRNAALGRENTPAETEFLKTGPRFGQ